jgi:hypothetical protein
LRLFTMVTTPTFIGRPVAADGDAVTDAGSYIGMTSIEEPVSPEPFWRAVLPTKAPDGSRPGGGHGR